MASPRCSIWCADGIIVRPQGQPTFTTKSANSRLVHRNKTRQQKDNFYMVTTTCCAPIEGFTTRPASFERLGLSSPNVGSQPGWQTRTPPASSQAAACRAHRTSFASSEAQEPSSFLYGVA